jgi:hypothetical protein
MSKAKELPRGVPPEGGAPAAPEGIKPPPHGTPRVIDPAGDLPRVCNQLDRVPAGSTARRYKCRVTNHDGFRKSVYILAADAASAKALCVQAVGLEEHIQALKESGAVEAEIPRPQVLAVELKD